MVAVRGQARKPRAASSQRLSACGSSPTTTSSLGSKQPLLQRATGRSLRLCEPDQSSPSGCFEPNVKSTSERMAPSLRARHTQQARSSAWCDGLIHTDPPRPVRHVSANRIHGDPVLNSGVGWKPRLREGQRARPAAWKCGQTMLANACLSSERD